MQPITVEGWIKQAFETMDRNEEYLIEFNNTSSREPFYHNMKSEAQRCVNQNNHLRAGIALLRSYHANAQQ